MLDYKATVLGKSGQNYKTDQSVTKTTQNIESAQKRGQNYETHNSVPKTTHDNESVQIPGAPTNYKSRAGFAGVGLRANQLQTA